MDSSVKDLKRQTDFENPEDVKVCIKIAEEIKSNPNEKKFIIDKEKKSIIFQRDVNKKRKFEFDYIFSEKEDQTFASKAIENDVLKYLKNDKNLFFMSFGEEKLGKSNFIYGSDNLITNDSFFKEIYDIVFKFLSKEKQYDNVLIDLFKISNEKYVIDQRNVVHDVDYDIIEVLNQMLKDNNNNNSISNNNSYLSDNNNNNKVGHLFFTIKFFKFTENNQENNEDLREVEILKAITFGDIEGFDNNFIDIIQNNTKLSIYNNNDQKMYSLLSLKYLIEALSDTDVNKYLEINSTLTILISDILKQNTFLFFFGFINPNLINTSQTMFTLEITNKIRNICPDFFFDIVQEIKKENSLIDYKYTKENFHILQTIFGEIIYYTDKTSDKIKKGKTNGLYDIDFNRKIKDMSLNNKFSFLKEYLEINNYDFGINVSISEIFDSVFEFFNNRTKWNLLTKAKDKIQKLNLEEEKFNNENLINHSSDTHNIETILKEISKNLKNIKNPANSFSNISDPDPNLSKISDLEKNTELKDQKNEPASKNDASTRHSLEKSIGNLILNQFLEKTKKAMNSIYKRFTAEDNCSSCFNAIDLKPINYKLEPEKIHTLRSIMYNTKSKKSEESLSECKIIIPKKKFKRKSSKKQKIIKTETEDVIEKDLLKVFGNAEISKISEFSKKKSKPKLSHLNRTLISESIKLNFNDSSTHINKIDNYISSKKSNLMKKLNDKIANNDYVVKMNSNIIDSDYQSQRLANINSKVQKFLNN